MLDTTLFARRRPERGGVRFTLLLLLVGIAGVVAGGQSLYTKLTNFAPTRMSCAEYLDKRPSAKWVELTDCVLPLLDATVSQSRFTRATSKAWLPLRAAPELAPGAKERALVQTEDPATIALISEAARLPSDPKNLGAFLEKNGDKLTPRRTVRGLVLFGIEANSSDRAQISRVNDNLEQDYVIIKENDEPSLARGIFGLLLGGAALGALAYQRKQAPRA